jgi:hypothetical protein
LKQVTTYFNAEKFESLFFVGVGMIALAVSAYFLMVIQQPFYNGVSYPFIGVALIQITVGTSVFFRSPKDILRVNEYLQADLSKIKSEEIPRMQVVMKNFVLYRWIEIILCISGFVLLFAGAAHSFWKGVGCGLALQAGCMLLLDYFAERRGKLYSEFLSQQIK